MARGKVTRTAPGWEERSYLLLDTSERRGGGMGGQVLLHPGFARLAVLWSGPALPTGSTLRLVLEGAANGGPWRPLAEFKPWLDGPVGVTWLEGDRLARGVAPGGPLECRLRTRWSGCGEKPEFGVEVVGIYRRKRGNGGGR